MEEWTLVTEAGHFVAETAFQVRRGCIGVEIRGNLDLEEDGRLWDDQRYLLQRGEKARRSRVLLEYRMPGHALSSGCVQESR